MENEDLLFQIAEKELDLLRDFSKVLKGERDAIISFSLEGIISENNKKEEILKRLEYLEGEKDTILNSTPDVNAITSGDAWQSLSRKMDHVMGDVRTGLKRNMSLLSFSIDHVKSSIEIIVRFISKTGYGKRNRERESVSFLLSREV
jgi:flagellar biosynthesis/type III secretory pathway chaperone